MTTRKVTIKQLIDYLRSKREAESLNQYLAKNLFKDPDHPIAKIDSDDFRFKHLLNHLEIVEEKDATTEEPTS